MLAAQPEVYPLWHGLQKKGGVGPSRGACKNGQASRLHRQWSDQLARETLAPAGTEVVWLETAALSQGTAVVPASFGCHAQ